MILPIQILNVKDCSRKNFRGEVVDLDESAPKACDPKNRGISNIPLLMNINELTKQRFRLTIPVSFYMDLI